MSIAYLTILRITIAFILGIIIAWLGLPVYIGTTGLFIYGVALLGVIGVVSLPWTKKIKYRKISGILLLLLSFSAGLVLSLYQKSYESERYFLQTSGEEHKMVLQLRDGGLENGYWRGIAEVEQVQNDGDMKLSLGKVYATFSCESVTLKNKDVVYVSTRVFPVKGPQNPGGFDMRSYLHPKGIRHQFFAGKQDFKVLQYHDGGGMQWLDDTRSFITQSLSDHLSVQNVGVANALIVGNKSFLDQDTRKSFAYAGAMHILAVSGLHVGIVVLIINFIIGHWRRKEGYRWMYALIGVLTIWFYALLTGLPVSVQRSALMFSLLVLGSAIGNKQNTIHSVLVSAFLLLLWNPLLLFDVGFQLSYAAVLGIVILQPIISKWFYSRYWIVQKLWEVCAVSLAAQIATLPFTMYYFGYFPVYFLLTNIVLLPLTPVVLTVGFLALLSYAISPFLGSYMFVLLDYTITALNGVISIIAHWPVAIVNNGSISWITAFLIACLSLAFGVWIARKQKQWGYISTVLLIIVLVVFNFEKRNAFKKDELVIYKTKASSLSSVKRGSQFLQVGLPENDYEKSIITDYMKHNWLSNGNRTKWSSSVWSSKDIQTWQQVKIGQNKIAVENQFAWQVNSHSFSLSNPEQLSFIWVKEDQFLDVKALEKSNWKGTIVLDPSNSYSHRATIKRIAKDLPVTIHDIKYDGAFIWEL